MECVVAVGPTEEHLARSADVVCSEVEFLSLQAVVAMKGPSQPCLWVEAGQAAVGAEPEHSARVAVNAVHGVVRQTLTLGVVAEADCARIARRAQHPIQPAAPRADPYLS